MAESSPTIKFHFDEKIAIVTGAAQGIGRAIAEAFVAAGARVVIAERNETTGNELAAKLGDRVLFVPTDMAEERAIENMIGCARDQWGGIDYLVNNAAIGVGSSPEQLTADDWNRVLAVNLTGPFLAAKYAAEHLRARRGAIVNIASTRAAMSEPHTEAYSASKAGLVGLTHALAVSLGPDIRVNCVSPGWIDTRDMLPADRARQLPDLTAADHAQHPAGRVGTPADIAQMVLYLCSDAAGFITGHNYTVDGGMTRKMIYVE